MSTKLITKAEFAEIIRKDEKAVDWMIYSRKAPKSAIISGRRMFRAADVEAWIEAAFSAEESK